MTGPDDRDEDDQALAGEYVLRLLPPDEARAFERRLAADPALRALVAGWAERLARLADEVAPVTPPARVKRGIEARLFDARAQRPRLSPARVFAGMATALALAFAVLVVLPIGPRMPSEPEFAARIGEAGGGLLVTAAVDLDSGALTLRRETGAARPGRVLELWLISAGAPAPVSLGVIPDTAEARIVLPAPLAASLEGGTLAISDEPPGGSPTGAPTGEVLAVGQLTAL